MVLKPRFPGVCKVFATACEPVIEAVGFGRLSKGSIKVE